MYTTKTKMLWGLLPGSLKYDPEAELYVQVRYWRSQPFKPKTGAENLDYILERSFRTLQRFPDSLIQAYGDLQRDRFRLLEPESQGAVLSVFPRIFECKLCGRIQHYDPPEGKQDGSDYFANGFYCKACDQSAKFRQLDLVQVHQCGYMGQMMVRPCQTHGWDHLYIDRQGTNLPSRYRLACLGPNGTRSDPQCTSMDPDLLLPGKPGGHPPRGCAPEKRLQRQGENGDPEAAELADRWHETPVRIRTCQDPMAFRPVGLAVINPAFRVPAGIADNEERISELIEAHLTEPALFDDASEGERVSIEHREELKRVIDAFEGTVEMLENPDIPQLWEQQKKSISENVPTPETYEDALRFIGRAEDTSDQTLETILGPREDRDELVDDLIEMVHLRDPASEFRGMDKTLQRLREHERAVADNFEKGRDLARRLGLSDIRLSQAFDIVQVQLGYTRNISDPNIAMIRPFEERGIEDKIPIYARQTGTEAILVLFDPVRVVRWLETTDLVPAEYFEELPEDLDESEARRWLLKYIHHSVGQGFGHVEEQPTAAVLALIHSASHLMIQTSGAYSGVEPRAMKELLYPSLPGVVLYSIQHGGFHLGGLTSLYEDHLHDWLEDVTREAKDCSNDPLCRAGRMHDTTDAASCYACLEGSELSCSLFNRNLDRAFLEGTVPQRTGDAFPGFWSDG